MQRCFRLVWHGIAGRTGCDSAVSTVDTGVHSVCSAGVAVWGRHCRGDTVMGIALLCVSEWHWLVRVLAATFMGIALLRVVSWHWLVLVLEVSGVGRC